MTIVSSSTLIAAPPSLVSATFLDWPHLTQWDKRYMKTLTPLLPDGKPDPSKTSGLSVVAGDKVHGTFWGGEAHLEILENEEARMRWKGVWHGLSAVRCFEWVEVDMDSDEGRKTMGTRFTQSDEAKGFMGGVLVVDGWMGGNLKKKFGEFGEDLKVWCEELERSRKGKI
ncbi:hypothetical protein ONS95_010200 [Cadophora gregata]|uniref:uncharacterized protein n=1 Tax=Cadophora gregata TaxID=51156 RepID=UPI0026DD07B7|nr:uncharacterized protein ONS95_010200 [Cadophora gregata]KAK0121925.1 hypothetical protein ONS95_010200 [Cadophora gregata]